MKKDFLWLTCLLCCFFVNCSDDEGGKDGDITGTSIVLSADKTALLANDTATVTFTVRDNAGTDVTSGCSFTINGEAHAGNTFKTKKPGAYKVVAKHGELVSNELTVTAVGENVELKLVASKTTLMADGGDFVYLSLLDLEGNDVSDLGVFHADGKAMEGRFFRTDKNGFHKITAFWAGKEVKGALDITAFASIDFTNRILAESLTATGCQYCKNTIEELTPFARENSGRFVLVEVHTWGALYKASAESGKDASAVDALYKAGGHTPFVYINRGERWKPLKDAGSGVSGLGRYLDELTSNTAIAIINTVEGNKVKVSATVGCKEGYAGKVGAILVEDGIMANQTDFSEPIEMYHLMRDYAPSVHGESVTLEAGKPSTMEFELTLAEVEKRENCRVIVYVMDEQGKVMNVQHTQLGVHIGYNE